MNRKAQYKDIQKYGITKRNQQARYRKRTGAGKYESRLWTIEEIEKVMKQEMPDRELSKLIHRSVGAIQKKRWSENKKSEGLYEIN